MFNPQPKPVRKTKKKSSYIKPGVKTNDWEAAKKILKPAFEAVGITYCEVGAYLMQFEEHREKMERISHNFFFTWAHGDKRDNLEGAELITFVALCCQGCHQYIEYRPDMREIITAVIEARRAQPSTRYYEQTDY